MTSSINAINIRRGILTVCLMLVLTGCGGRSGEGGSSGRVVLENKGSDTLVNVAQAWAEAYSAVNPNVAIAVTGGGSGTGIAALINGTVDIANASREITDSERQQAAANGHEPVEFIVGYDALAVFVNPNNPLTEITFEQLTQIYGEGGTAAKWTDLGIEVPGCAGQEIIVVSRQNNSGTYAYFRETVLGEHDFRLGTRDMHGSKDVVDLVQNTACAIGYSGLAYATSEVKMLAIKTTADATAIMPSVKTAVDRTYPIARPLFMYSSGQPTGPVKAYLDWILSDEGQCIIADKGYAPAHSVMCSGPAAAGSSAGE